MRLLQQSFEFEHPINGAEILRRIELAGRTAYKSEDRITPDSAAGFVDGIITRRHESVLEHITITVRVITDRGVSHEIVRHRIGSYTQESTRYCNYNKSGGVCLSPMLDGLTEEQKQRRKILYEHMEYVYSQEIMEGVKPQQARDNLPTCTKTEIVITYNLREWRHFFKLRTAKGAHPRMREIACKMLAEFQERVPVVFDDIVVMD